MRSLSIILCVLALTTPALAAEPKAAPAAEFQEESEPELKQLGLALQTGLPDGFTGSVVYRPMSWLRTHVGAGYNMIGASLQGGLALIPFGWGPSLTLEGGHYFEGNANGLARKMIGSSFEDSAVLERVGYDYANAHLGLELGERTFTFFIHGGMSYISTQINNVDVALQEASDMSADGTELRVAAAPKVRAFVPSLKLGFIVYVW
jgi:hypothetical protein